MHVGYHYRWLRPTEFVEQDPDLINTKFAGPSSVVGCPSSPKGDPMGPEPDFHPSSRYWLTENQDDVPLREWALARESG